MPKPEPALETERLILRPPCGDDFEAWAAIARDEEVMHHLGGTKSRFDAWNHFTSAVGSWHVLGFHAFSVIEKRTGRWVGRVGPLHPDGWPGDEIGWTLAREAWGKGYATEAATAAIDWTFAHLGWVRIIHCITPANKASRRSRKGWVPHCKAPAACRPRVIRTRSKSGASRAKHGLRAAPHAPPEPSR